MPAYISDSSNINNVGHIKRICTIRINAFHVDAIASILTRASVCRSARRTERDV